VARNAAENGTVAGIGIVGHDVRDVHPADGTHRSSFGRAHPVAEPQEDGRIGNFPHGDVGYRDVFDMRAIDGFESQTAGAVEDHVGDDDVTEIAFRFRADLDAPGGAVAVGRLFERSLVSAVHQRADVETADQTVGDGDILRGARQSQRVGAL
jgi:hypothetical protein